MYKRSSMANESCAMKIGEGKSRATSAPLVDSNVTEHVYHTIITVRTAEQKWKRGNLYDSSRIHKPDSTHEQ